MATQTLDDIDITNAWLDLVTVEASLASAVALIQLISPGKIQIIWGGGSPASTKTGVILGQEDSMKGDAAAIWVRSYTPTAKISVTLI